MALLAGAAAAVIAAVPVAAIGIMNAIRPQKLTPKTTSLRQDSQKQRRQQQQQQQQQQKKIEAPAPRRTVYSVLDDPHIFPSSLSGPETYASDLFRDPYSNQLYLCTENEIGGADTDENLHPSSLAGVRNLDVLNGRVGNEGIRRQEQLRNGRDWSNDPSASLLRSMDVSHDTRIQHAYRAVNEFKRDGCKPPGTGLLHREEEFGANMRGLNTDDVASIRRDMVNPFNVKIGQAAPMEPHTFSVSAAPGHEGSHSLSKFDVGQLRRQRGTVDSKALGIGRGNNGNGDLAQTARGQHQALLRAAERDVGAAASGLGVSPAPAAAANRASHAAVRGNETAVHSAASKLGGTYTVRGGDVRGRQTAVVRSDDTNAFASRENAGADLLDAGRPGFGQTVSHLKADDKAPFDKPRFDIGGVGDLPRPDRSQTVSHLKSDAAVPGANPRQQLSAHPHTRASSVLARQAGRAQPQKAPLADGLAGAAGSRLRLPVAPRKRDISAAHRAGAAGPAPRRPGNRPGTPVGEHTRVLREGIGRRRRKARHQHRSSGKRPDARRQPRLEATEVVRNPGAPVCHDRHRRDHALFEARARPERPKGGGGRVAPKQQRLQGDRRFNAKNSWHGRGIQGDRPRPKPPQRPAGGDAKTPAVRTRHQRRPNGYADAAGNLVSTNPGRACQEDRF